MTSIRPDEQAASSEIDRAQTRDSTLKSALKTGATTIGAVASLGGGLDPVYCLF